MINIPHILQRLAHWSRFAQRDWYAIPGQTGLGCYGTGYNHWGYQTNQRYAAAMAVLATHLDSPGDLDRALVMENALAAFRYSLWSHVTGPGPGACTDGTKWGQTWISALGIERMMHGVAALDPHLTDQDRDGLRAMLLSEADWQLRQHRRGSLVGVQADRWGHSGKNNPESNIWVGALLWRVAEMFPDHADADAWRQEAHRYFINGVSVPSDADNDTIVSGKSVRERFVGANFFENYALDHHGYFNVGYMAICVSQAALLHFDLKIAGYAAPESLHFHQADLWRVLRKMIFADGRLARLGGDTRVRYAYCQEYLLPSLLYAADHLGDDHAMTLAEAQLKLIEDEASCNDDGGFYSSRLAELYAYSPYYYTRLESDRALALTMAACYAPRVGVAASSAKPSVSFEASVAGGWIEPEYGAVLHRSPTRLASFAWRAQGLAQGLCLPPDDGHLAEWQHNLGGVVRFTGQQTPKPAPAPRKLQRCNVQSIQGGFVTSGAVLEGTDLFLADGWRQDGAAVHALAMAALPDGHTIIALEHCRSLVRIRTTRVMGMNLNVPNDLFNASVRTIHSQTGTHRLMSPASREELIDLGRWCCVDNRIGVVGLSGNEEGQEGQQGLGLSRSRQRRGGAYESLYVEEIGWPCIVEPRWWDAQATVIDAGWAVLASVSTDETRRFADANAAAAVMFDEPLLRGLRITAMDQRTYLLLANFGDVPRQIASPCVGAVDLVTGDVCGDDVVLPAGGAVLLQA